MCISDSSLGNASRYSQGGYFLLLANSENDGMICGNCTVIAARSSKSKRVASSTMHAETLALASGLEEAGYVQTWLHELNNPHLSTWDLLHVSGPELTPIVGITDCNDLYESLIKPAMPTPSNRALVLYLAALREQHDLQKVQAWAWCDTRDNLAAVLTKLNDDGTLPLAPYTAALRFSCWEPVHAYRWQGVLTAPSRPATQATMVRMPAISSKKPDPAKPLVQASSACFGMTSHSPALANSTPGRLSMLGHSPALAISTPGQLSMSLHSRPALMVVDLFGGSLGASASSFGRAFTAASVEPALQARHLGASCPVYAEHDDDDASFDSAELPASRFGNPCGPIWR